MKPALENQPSFQTTQIMNTDWAIGMINRNGSMSSSRTRNTATKGKATNVSARNSPTTNRFGRWSAITRSFAIGRSSSLVDRQVSQSHDQEFNTPGPTSCA